MLFLQSNDLQNRFQRARRNVIARMSRDRNQIRFRRMLKVSMAACDPHALPTIRFDQPDQVPNLHLFHSRPARESPSPDPRAEYSAANSGTSRSTGSREARGRSKAASRRAETDMCGRVPRTDLYG